MRYFLFILILGVLLGDLQAGDRLRVLVWNTEKGSNPYGASGRQRVLKVIKDSRADVVLWQESYKLEGADQTLGQWVSKQLGWNIWQGESPHLAVVSRFEQVKKALHHPWHGLGARIRDEKGREFEAWSIWLDYRCPVQWKASDSPESSNDDLIACDTLKSDRFQQTQALLDELDQRGLLEEEIPVLVGGDWNSSSHLDWTQETAKVYDHRRELALPIGRLMEAANFVDAYRFAHPDPVVAPGNTWSPRDELRENGKPDPPERIDRLYVKNAIGRPGLAVVGSQVLPENPDDARGLKKEVIFPSDHAALLIEFEWVETTRTTSGAFYPDSISTSPRLDHRPPRSQEPDFAPTKIAWGSCFQESRPCPMLEVLADKKPELYLALGDNIYGDTKQMDVLRRKYRRLARHPAWRALTTSSRVMATWDDHDYGLNDGGRDYGPSERSKEVFLDFFDEPLESERRRRKGIYTSTMLGDDDHRLQIIMLDLRTFRSGLERDQSKAYPELGPYRVLREEEPQMMLGEKQWSWLEAELRKPARIRLIGLSTQLGTAHNGYEAWINMPKERDRFVELIKKTRAQGVVLLSGDTHWAEISLIEKEGLYPLYDLTSSSLNQVWDPAGANPNRIGKAYTQANAGLMTIDWEKEILRAGIIDQWGQEQFSLEIEFRELTFQQFEKRGSFLGKWQSAFGDLVLTQEGDLWVGTYPQGTCELKLVAGCLEGKWMEGDRFGRCRFERSRCGRFLKGAYSRGEGPLALPWPAWRAGARGISF